MIVVIISQMRTNQCYYQKCTFYYESIKLSDEGSDIFDVPVLNIFLCQQFFYPSIVFFISGIEKPNKDAKLSKLKAYTNEEGYLS